MKKRIFSLLCLIVLLLNVKDGYSMYPYPGCDYFIENLNLENCFLRKENKFFGKDSVQVENKFISILFECVWRLVYKDLIISFG